MKKVMTIVLALMMLALTACGGSKNESKDVDLASFYAGMEEKYDWTQGLVDIEGEMLEAYYPGLSEISTKQFIAKMPMMSAVVNEFVFLQCESEEDAGKAAQILQQRVDMQAEGGAWYPESMEAWGRAGVIQQGTYVAMIASAEFQAEIEEAFQAQFA